MVWALLTYRNTPDPGCKLSPAEILLGRKLKDTLPTIDKKVMAFNNPQFSNRWREAWKAKKDALKTRYVPSIETLSEHSRPLPPLQIGDGVIIQNRSGRFPKKWDKSGIIVETKANDQYVVKVAGSGRLTLRNRRFLRCYNLTNKHAPTGLIPDTIPFTPPSSVAHTASSPQHQHHDNLPSSDVPSDVPSPVCTPTRQLDNSVHVRQSSTPLCYVSHTPGRTLFGDVTPEEVVPPVASTPVLLPPSTRPPRARIQRKVYDSSTGTYTEPKAVPDHV